MRIETNSPCALARLSLGTLFSAELRTPQTEMASAIARGSVFAAAPAAVCRRQPAAAAAKAPAPQRASRACSFASGATPSAALRSSAQPRATRGALLRVEATAERAIVLAEAAKPKWKGAALKVLRA